MKTATVDPSVLNEYRRRLRRARRRLLSTVTTTDAELAGLDTKRLIDRVDEAAVEATMAVMTELEHRELHELAEIDAAEARLESGVFGVCEACGKPIVRTRLRAVPTARLCLSCQSWQEVIYR